MTDRSERHLRATVRFDGERYLLRCDCGWDSPPMETPQEVGRSWDNHREGSQR